MGMVLRTTSGEDYDLGGAREFFGFCRELGRVVDAAGLDEDFSHLLGIIGLNEEEQEAEEVQKIKEEASLALKSFEMSEHSTWILETLVSMEGS